MITGAQIRAARALLAWSAHTCAERCGLTRNTVQRLEREDGVPATRAQTLLDLQRAFEAQGVVFIGTPEDGPGVRLFRR